MELRSAAVDHDSTGYVMNKAADEIEKLRAEIDRLREAITMADNRLETALYKIGDETEICEHCISLAKSYLQDALEHRVNGR